MPRPGSGRIGEGAARQLWSSRQAIGEELALRRLGFSPAGIVIGSVNSWGIPFPRRRSRKRRSVPPPTDGTRWQTSPLDDFVVSRAHGGYAHDWRIGKDGQATRHVGWTWELVMHERREHQLVDTAVTALLDEARALGAHGVIGISLAMRHLGTERTHDYPVLEVAVTGTAVTVVGAGAADRPFTTGLAGTDLLKLAEHGWAPVQFAVGVGHVRGVAGTTSRLALRSTKNGEVQQLSEIRQQSLEIAAQNLTRRSVAPSQLIVGVEEVLDDKHLEAHVRLTGSTLCRLPGGTTPTGPHYLRVVNLSR
jgi:uncharacterized protein YbjQ (UPF0145 family)